MFSPNPTCAHIIQFRGLFEKVPKFAFKMHLFFYFVFLYILFVNFSSASHKVRRDLLFNARQRDIEHWNNIVPACKGQTCLLVYGWWSGFTKQYRSCSTIMGFDTFLLVSNQKIIWGTHFQVGNLVSVTDFGVLAHVSR